MKTMLYSECIEKTDKNFFYTVQDSSPVHAHNRRIYVYAVRTSRKRPVKVATIDVQTFADAGDKSSAARALVLLYGFKLNVMGCLPKRVQLYELGD